MALPDDFSVPNSSAPTPENIVPNVSKEAEPRPIMPDRGPIVEVGKNSEQGFQELEQNGQGQYTPKATLELSEPISHSGQVLVSSPAPTQPKIILPVTENFYQQALKQHIENAARWLAEWVKKVLKKNPERTVFR